MLINNLDKMEVIVNSSSDLEWDGWNVVKYTPSHNAMLSPDGSYKNGQWFKKKVFPITEQGWNIPENLGKKYAQMER